MKHRWWLRIAALLMALLLVGAGLAEQAVEAGFEATASEGVEFVEEPLEEIPGEADAVLPPPDGVIVQPTVATEPEIPEGEAATPDEPDAPVEGEDTPEPTGETAQPSDPPVEGEVAPEPTGETAQPSDPPAEGEAAPEPSAGLDAGIMSNAVETQAEEVAVEETEAIAETQSQPETPTEDEAAPEPDLRLGVGERVALTGASGAFRSDRPEVAAVEASTGAVTAMSVGTAVITCEGEDGAQASWIVEVLAAPGKLTLAKAKLSLGKGERLALEVRVPEGTAASKIKYSSSKKSIVTVDAAGVLRARKKGTAVITATAYNGAKVKCTVKVVKAPSKVKLSASKRTLCVGESAMLKATLSSGSASKITWTSGNPDVVAVDGSGKLVGVSAGTATVKAAAFNGKSASCKVTVLAGSAPTAVALDAAALTLGVKETRALTPVLADGEAAAFTWSSSKAKVAQVSAKGVVTAKKTGTATITVATHNGKKAKVKVKVVKAPSKVTLSRSKLSMRVGESAPLSAYTPSGTSSAFTWSSSDSGVASVDADGCITAKKAGTAVIRVKTYNKKSGQCTVTVTEDGPSVEEGGEEDTVDDEDEQEVPAQVSAKKMVANLRASSALGSKRDAIANVAELLMANGFEPAFAAGVGANIYSEGTYGLFESSRYVTYPKKRPRYFCYLDGGEYYTKKDGEYVLTAVYMSKSEMKSYTGKAEARQRFGEKDFYLNNYSRRYVQNVDLNALEALMNTLAAGSWEGKFGLGIVQWTGSRTRTLVSFYRKHAGKDASSITAAQVVAAENEMILYDFKGSYNGVYSAWKNANRADLNTAEAARSAGALVCTKYEIPVDKENKAVTRGNKAKEIFDIMMG